MSKLDFSLVTTCRNEISSFDRWKQNVLNQTRRPSEIVIVDAFSDDGTFEKLSDWAAKDNIVKIISEKGNAAHGRNIAIRHAKFDIILSTDMGVRLSPIWCEELITPFENKTGTEVVIGNTCIDKESLTSIVSRAEYYVEKGGSRALEPGSIPSNRSVAYLKSVWEKLCGLPEDLTFYADDSVFGRQMVQAGLRFEYAPEAMTYWARPHKLNQFTLEYFNYGKGDGEAFIKTFVSYRWHIEKNLPIGLVPALTSIIQLLKPSVINGMKQALQKKDVPAFLLVPVLTAQRWHHYAKGYHIGYKKGEIFCQDCRNRLNRDKKGYSII